MRDPAVSLKQERRKRNKERKALNRNKEVKGVIVHASLEEQSITYTLTSRKVVQRVARAQQASDKYTYHRYHHVTIVVGLWLLHSRVAHYCIACFKPRHLRSIEVAKEIPFEGHRHLP